jgi:gliding motility-associated-like protein
LSNSWQFYIEVLNLEKHYQMRYFFLFLIIFPEICFSQTKISIRSDVVNTSKSFTGSIYPNFKSADRVLGPETWTWNRVPGAERVHFTINISELPVCSEIIEARLSLWAAREIIYPKVGKPGEPTYGDNNSARIYRISEPWDSNKITWLNPPFIDPNDFVDLNQSVSSAQDYLNLDLTKMVQNMVTSGNYGMMFKMNNETTPYNSMFFYDEKSANINKRPLLEITYIPNGSGNKATILTNKTEYCIGEKINFSFNSSSQISSYSWFLNNKYISNNKSDQITAATLGDNKLTLYYFNGCISDSTNFIIKIVDKKQATVLDSICPGHILKFHDLTIDSPGIYSTLVKSTNSCDTTFTIVVSLKRDCKKCVIEVNTIDSICENDVYDFKGTTILNPGTYSKTVKAVNSCDTIFNLILLLKKDCKKCVLEVNTIDSICENEVYNFKGTTILTPGTYSKIVKSVNSCDTLFNLVLLLKKDCKKCLIVISKIDSICEGETYFYQGNTILSPGIYIKSIPKKLGCDTSYILELKLNSNCNKCSVQFPNTFSPNNDNVNDYFIPFIDCKLNTSDIKSYTVKIYNRWGQKVFQYNETSNGWDGRFHNNDPVIDTYIYIAEVYFHNNQSKVFKGDITLLK